MTNDDPTDSTNYVEPDPGDPLGIREAVRRLASATRCAAEASRRTASAAQRMRAGMPSAPPLAAAEAVDPRHTVVMVRTVPTIGEPGDVHRYQDAGGLSWTVYGEGDDQEEGALDIENSAYATVASYPSGTWLHVCYEGYMDRPGDRQ